MLTSVRASPSSRVVRLTCSRPATAISSSVATLSLIVSIRATRSRTVMDTSSSMREIPTGPGVRLVGVSTRRSAPSRAPLEIAFSMVSATWTFITDAGVTRSSVLEPDPGPPETGAA